MQFFIYTIEISQRNSLKRPFRVEFGFLADTNIPAVILVQREGRILEEVWAIFFSSSSRLGRCAQNPEQATAVKLTFLLLYLIVIQW